MWTISHFSDTQHRYGGWTIVSLDDLSRYIWWSIPLLFLHSIGTSCWLLLLLPRRRVCFRRNCWYSRRRAEGYLFKQGVGVVGCDDLHKHETSTRVRQTALKTDKLNKLSSQSTHTMFLLFITQIDSSRPRQICTHKILGKLDTTIRIPRPDITRNIYDGRRRV